MSTLGSPNERLPTRRSRAVHVARRSLPRRVLGAVLRWGILAVACVVLLTAAFGWLYWVRRDVAGWPGPTIASLPLDELASHDRVPLLVLLVVLGIFAATAGLIARAAGVDRLAAAIVLGASAGGWSYLHVAASYYVVRQIAASQALGQATSSPTVYLAAAIAALGGALLGRTRRSGSALTAFAAVGVALAGLIDVLAAFSPSRPNALTSVSPSVLLPLARAVDLPVGLLLIVGSRGLARRSRAALRISVLALGLSSLARLALFPTHYLSAMLMLGVAAVLLARRASFEARTDPAALSSVPWRILGVLLLTTAVATTGLLAHQAFTGEPLRFGHALVNALRALAGRPLSTRAGGERHFAVWFPWSVSASLALGVLWAVVPCVAAWRPRFQRGAAQSDDARRLVRLHGGDSLAPFALRADKSLFFAPVGQVQEEQAVIAYRVVRGVALGTGSPVGAPGARGPALQAFRLFAHRRGWTVGVLGVSGEDLALYESLGFVGIYHGDEAFIDVEKFSLSGGRMKAVRQAVNRVERHGYRSTVLPAGGVPPWLRREMLQVDRAWIAGARRTGFAMELDELFRLGGDDAVFVLGSDPSGRLAGLLHLASCPASRTMSLSSMPRQATVPNGFTSWLIVRAVEWCAMHGMDTLSLNFSPLAGLFDAEAAQSVWKRTQRRAAMRVKAALSLQLDNLQLFNRQFCPEFRPRYVVLERWTDLPRVVVAAMAAEGYLPFAERLRGWPAPRARDLSPGTVGTVRPDPLASTSATTFER